MDAAAQEVVRVIMRDTPNHGWVNTTDSYARVDGLIYTNARGLSSLSPELVAIIEIKCRNISLGDLWAKFKGELMVDASKIEALRSISAMLCAPSYLVSYLMASGVVLKTKIANDKGEIICKKRNELTVTSAGMNGGQKEKEVSYIKLDGTEIISTEEEQKAV